MQVQAEPPALDVAEANIGNVRDPYSGYAETRARGPVVNVDHFGASVFMVYRFEEAERVLGDPDTFSSRINGRWMRTFLGRTVMEMDGRDHVTHRGLIGHAFRPKAVRRWESELIAPTAHELIDRFAGRGHAELVREFSWQFPALIIARMVGVPREDTAMWLQRAVQLERSVMDPAGALEAKEGLKAYFDPMIEDRRREPREDLISDLVRAELDGERLDDDLIHSFLRLLVPAGAGTTYRLIGSAMFALVSQPETLERVRADRSLVAPAVEEALRWESPVQFAARETTAETEIAGVTIPAKVPVTVALGAANHDDLRWDEPERFDLDRAPQSHVAFGDGPHFCLGAHLARLEAQVAVGALLDRLTDLRLEPGEDDPHVVGFAFRSPTSVPVAFTAA